MDELSFVNPVEVFKNDDFGEVRVVMINGEPWFVAADVCDAFGETNRNRAMQSLDADEKGYTQMTTPGGMQQMSIVNEPGLYALLFVMQPKKARGVTDEYIEERERKLKSYKRWVTHEVLPSVRKHGGYLTPDTIEKVLSDPDTIIRLATDLKAERQKRLEAEKQRDILLHVQKTYTTTEIAKELGMKSAQALNNWLVKMKIQFKQNGTWVLYSEYADLGYTEIKQNVLESGRIVYDRRWTNYGRAFILELWEENGNGISDDD